MIEHWSVSGTSSPSFTWTAADTYEEPEFIILEDQPWVDLYEYDDYV